MHFNHFLCKIFQFLCKIAAKYFNWF